MVEDREVIRGKLWFLGVRLVWGCWVESIGKECKWNIVGGKGKEINVNIFSIF